ncbi:hypothetical protein JKF63_02573 [Porcisia hertigi]|uniref:Uncharacterized protein n=1 Tax=Porcisia hertigi TaxID=2761500 RepID=A0A836H9S0_9TRYP|nr:hypothetical protein JKF63_02573 [Porcisia hertigi]
MSMVQLHTHFVAARNYADVRAVIGLLKRPIDAKDFERDNGASYIPSVCGSTIHLGDPLNGLSYSTEPSSPKTKSSGFTANVDTAGTSFTHDASGTSKRPPAAVGDASAAAENEGATLSSIHRSLKSSTPNDSRSRLSRPASMTEVKRHRPKVLCIWDVDDTLVASGVSGVRQNSMFRDSELVALFRGAGDTARHLFLSQGSIDDIFEKPSGRMRCLRPFLERTAGFSGGACSKADDSSRSSSASRASRGGDKRKKFSLASAFRCGGGDQTKEQPFSVSSTCNGGGVPPQVTATNSSSNYHDLRHFAPGTVVVRLATVGDRSETVEDAAFLDDPNALPTCSRTFNGQVDDKAERVGRWLLLRPEVWGITLASMSMFFPPSPNTAYVNGKIYRKMDVVWSLAMSGEWDSVFFMDNNLSEVGVVRYGLQMSDLLDLRSQRRVHLLFQADYLLLAISAKLSALELQHGRDVTKPPDTAGLSSSLKTKRNGNSPAIHAQKAPAVTATSSSLSEKAPKSSNAEETCELTLSKSAVMSSCGSVGRTGSRRGGLFNSNALQGSPRVGRSCIRSPANNGVDDDVNIVRANGDDNALSHSDLTLTAVAQGPCESSSSGNSVDLDHMSLTLSSSSSNHVHIHGGDEGDHGTPAITSLDSIVRQLKPPRKDVALIVVNLHMSSEAYRQVLTAARTNDTGQRSMQRTGSGPYRFVGQPVFVGDRSCTDEQYEAVLKYFQEAENTLLQLIDEEMRINGFVNFTKSSRWMPSTRMVYAPFRVRPTCVPHMLNFYKSFFEDLEERLVAPLQRTGGTGASGMLQTEAQRQYYVLQRVLPFIDPYLTGDLGRILFDMYVTDGSIPRSLAEQLRKAIAKTRARLDPGHERR